MTPIDYIPQPKQQLLHKSSATEILYGGAAGPGKIVNDSSKILTPWGWKDGVDIDVGSIILNPDGSRQQVIAISPRITAPGYTVKLHDGGQTTVMEGHLWLSWRSGKRSKSVINGNFGQSSVKVVTTGTLKRWADQAIKASSNGKRPSWPLIPVCKPLHYERAVNRNTIIDIDPYLLGLLLGDGHISNGSVAITSNDVGHLTEVLTGYNYGLDCKKNTETYTFRFRGDTLSGLKESLKKVGLYGKLAHEKSIPLQYLFGSIEDRIAILQGLMDTDGTADSRGGWPSFCSVSKQLANDVRSLVFSLGGTATISSRYPTYTTESGDTATGQKAYNVYIKMPDNSSLFRLKRKSDIAGICPATPMYRRVVDVEIGPDVSGRCITVDNPNGLYITDDFIVTHNSHALRMEGLIWCLRIPNIQVYLFRRTFPELEKNHILPSRMYFPSDVCTYKSRDRRWEFDNGSMLHFCHCQYESDVFQYQGSEIHVLLIDELTTFTEFQYDYLRGRVRCPLPVPKNFRHKIPFIACASNPGGVGHQFVKERWVDYLPPYQVHRAPNKEGGMKRCYIPGLLEDNKILLETDPDYIHRLDALPEPYRTAYKDGDWDIFMGQAFMLSRKHHVIEPIKIPENAPVYMTFDWGFGAPFSIGWWWIDADNRLIRFDEWYGWNGEPNKGIRIEDSKIAEGIKKREARQAVEQHQRVCRLAGHDCFSKKPDYKGGGQGKSTAEVFAEHGIYLTKGDSDRGLKIRQFRERLKVPENGDRPMLQVYSNCEQFIRTVSTLQTDPKNVEDIDTMSEDHCFAGDTLVDTDQGQIPIRDLVGKSGYVLTAGGYWTRFNRCRLIAKDVKTVRITFEDGRSIVCTPDHRFYVKTNKYIEAKDLIDEICHVSIPINKNIREVLTWKSLLSTEQSKFLTVSHIGNAVVIFRERVKDFIGWCGNSIMELSQRAVMSIIKTMMLAITSQITLNYSKLPSIHQSIRDKTTTLHGLSQCTRAPLCGMEVQQVSNGTSSNMKKTASIGLGSRQLILARNAGKNLNEWFLLDSALANANSAIGKRPIVLKANALSAGKALSGSDQLVQKLARQERHGKPAKVLEVKQSKNSDVYCLDAAFTHAFCVGGGILVHNCYDESSHLCMARPIGQQKPVKQKNMVDARIDMLERGDAGDKYSHEVTKDIHFGYATELYADSSQDYRETIM